MSRLPTATDPLASLRSLLGGDPHSPRAFPDTSRYAATETARHEAPDGRSIVYLRRRFVPSPERFAAVRVVAVKDTDRLDNLAAEHVGDPEQFWQLCDANGALRPKELEVEGRLVRITLPVDVP